MDFSAPRQFVSKRRGIVVTGCIAAITLAVTAFLFSYGSSGLPMVWASVEGGEKVEMFISSHSWSSGFIPGLRTSSINGFTPPEPFDDITLTVRPQETITLASDNKLIGCRRLDVYDDLSHMYNQFESDFIKRANTYNLTLTIPFEPGEYLIRMYLTFKRGEVTFYLNLIVQDS